MSIRFAMNRTCAPQLELSAFLRLAVGAGVQAVELRNDIAGREFADGMPAPELKSRLEDAGLGLASVNALQRFNEWTPQREAEARHLISYAAALGAPGVVLCPVHDEGHGWTQADAARHLRLGLKALQSILLEHGVTGYVEPLGMQHSTMKRQDMAVAAIDEIGGWNAYRLCFDTFQFFRCGDTALFAEHIGLVHISGIARHDLPADELSEPDRGLVFADDRVGNVAQLKSLFASGYSGFVSMEPFSPQVQQDPQLPTKLAASLQYLAASIGA